MLFEEKAKSDIIFNQIDSDKDGYATGLEVRDVFLKTGLSPMILANIWGLCDIGATGKLNSEQFALAMHFVNKKLATGLDAPHELLPEHVPPSLRKKTTNNESTLESRELEELQLQVTELQREKLFYEQRATEHDTFTRQKRTELSNLELEMESLFKTLQDREMKKSEEQKKLVDLENKLVKLDMDLEELKAKHGSEKEEIDRLKIQINHMELAMKNKDNDLNKIKAELKLFQSEKANLEIKLNSRKTNLSEINSSMQLANEQVAKNKNKLELLKTLQVNLNKLIREYDNLPVTDLNRIELNQEIKQLEEENAELNLKIKTAIEALPTQVINETPAVSFSPTNQQPAAVVKNEVFEAYFPPTLQQMESPQQQLNFLVDDPFQAFDPFKETATVVDPFKTAPLNDKAGDDPFSNPFDSLKNPSVFNDFDDPFSNIVRLFFWYSI